MRRQADRGPIYNPAEDGSTWPVSAAAFIRGAGHLPLAVRRHWTPLRAERSRRMEEVPFKMENAKRRAFCMIYNRLRGYAKACKDFCNERRHTGRKHMLPAALHTKRCLVKVQQHGEYVIHGAVEKRAKKATQG